MVYNERLQKSVWGLQVASHLGAAPVRFQNLPRPQSLETIPLHEPLRVNSHGPEPLLEGNMNIYASPIHQGHVKGEAFIQSLEMGVTFSSFFFFNCGETPCFSHSHAELKLLTKKLL